MLVPVPKDNREEEVVKSRSRVVKSQGCSTEDGRTVVSTNQVPPTPRITGEDKTHQLQVDQSQVFEDESFIGNRRVRVGEIATESSQKVADRPEKVPGRSHSLSNLRRTTRTSFRWVQSEASSSDGRGRSASRLRVPPSCVERYEGLLRKVLRLFLSGRYGDVTHPLTPESLSEKQSYFCFCTWISGFNTKGFPFMHFIHLVEMKLELNVIEKV